MSLRVSDHYDSSQFRCHTVVIGSGAGGAVISSELAKAQVDVIVVEEGAYYDTSDFAQDPSELMSKLYRNGGAVPFLGSPLVAFAEGRCVGGGTVINGGVYAETPQFILKHWANDLALRKFSPQEFSRHIAAIESAMAVVQEEIGPGNLDSQILKDAAIKLGLSYEINKRNVVACKNTNRCPTGCPTGAKQSVNFNYLREASHHGARIFSRLKVLKIRRSGSRVTGVLAQAESGKRIEIIADRVVVSGGPVQSPFLLRKGRLSKLAGQKIGYHTPLKVIAQFQDVIDAQNGTSSKVVINAYGEEGIKIAASNLRREYIALALAPFGKSVLNEALDNFEKMAIYMALVRTKSYGSILTSALGQPLIRSHYASDDTLVIRNALEKTCEILFAGGAIRLFLPMHGSLPVENMIQCRDLLSKLDPKKLDILTVHAMSSCAMGIDERSSVVDENGKIWGLKNLYVSDASVLPTTVGVGPQASVMAISRMIAEGLLNEKGI